MRNCLECKWCDFESWEDEWSCDQGHWRINIPIDDRRRAVRAIKTAETCPDFEGEESE